MVNRVPDVVIDQIRNSVDIVDVIGDYVQLKKQGRNYFGLCPFHGENTPSFSVSADKQIYHCFGCGAGGNAFSFLMELEGLSFTEAVRTVAEKADIPFEYEEQLPSSSTPKPSNKMIEAHDLLRKFYHHLLVNTKEGQEAYDYLIGRGFTREVIDEFEIGFALDSWEFVTKFLTKRGYEPEELEKAGILVKREGKDSYLDRFRNRIMFPLADLQGKTVAFSGRILGEGQPKYLNTPETSIFSKGKILYNFHRAKKHIRKNQEVILLEGYADVIAAHKAGCFNGVATMGTALTEEQAATIKRNVENVIICYDSDGAGIEAAYKAGQVLTKVGCTVKVAVMPSGYDPDDYVNQYGTEAFRGEVLEASLTLMAFKMRYLRRGKNLQNEAERIRYIDEVVKEISLLPRAVERDHYLRQISQEFSLSLDALKQETQQNNRFEKRKKDNDHVDRNTIARPAVIQSKLLPAYQNAERFLIAHMLKDRDVAFRVQDALQGNFNVEEHRAIVTYLYAFYEEGHEPELSLFMQKLEDPKLSRLASQLAMIDVDEEITEQVLNDYIQQVLIYPKWLTIKEKEQEKQAAERQKDYLKAASIAMEIIQLKKLLK
ncbi:DNA primase [Priestia koreensis]|uniref:DNA primase n=1 Tax=Priestia koreensis TaxID=284581 RepID=A0A0M0KYI4_9BACI|nr:DNA primase [Priestia koreensis]KOO43886.1 DNA primase [Priestia koreensis]